MIRNQSARGGILAGLVLFLVTAFVTSSVWAQDQSGVGANDERGVLRTGPGGVGAPADLTAPPSAPGVAPPGTSALPGQDLPMVGSPGVPQPQPQILGASPLRGGSTPANRCPAGYLEDNSTRRLPNYSACLVDTDVRSFCATQLGYYACGLNGQQCCPGNTDNVCFPGAYACTVGTTLGGGPKTACCVQR